MKNLPVAIPETAQGRIITSVGGLYTVETFSGICTCKARGIFRKRGITPYVGDYVQLSEDGVIQEILPRKNSILRPPVSNLDQIFFVVSTCHPAPNLLLLDSFLTVAIYQDIQPAVVLTKMDLHRGEQLEKLYTDAGIPVYPVEYDKPETVAAVSELLAGKISMMTGNSGVGKSTLLNAIDPSLQIATGGSARNWDAASTPPDRYSCIPVPAAIWRTRPDFPPLRWSSICKWTRNALQTAFRSSSPIWDSAGSATVHTSVKRAVPW